jgi:hypothetical protein
MPALFQGEEISDISLLVSNCREWRMPSRCKKSCSPGKRCLLLILLSWLYLLPAEDKNFADAFLSLAQPHIVARLSSLHITPLLPHRSLHHRTSNFPRQTWASAVQEILPAFDQSAV